MLELLELTNFRNFEKNIFDISKNKNLIIGKNGYGKSNILEAITLFSNNTLLEIDFQNLVKKGADFLYINLVLKDKNEISISFDKKTNKKKYFINKKSSPKKNIIKLCPKIVLFHPMIMNMMYLSPSLRRHFLDNILVNCFPEYNKILKNYKKILINRNRTLKNISENKSKKQEIYFRNNSFIEASKEVYKYREKIINFIEKNTKYLNKYLDNKIENITFLYKTKIDRNNVRDSISNYINKNLERDIILKKTFIGPHLDDFDIILDNVSLISFASRGEVKSLILGLKFLEAKFLDLITNKKTIFVIDDLLSELDENHINILLKNISNNQTFITSIKNLDIKFHKILL